MEKRVVFHSKWLPYALLVLFVLVWGEPDIKAAINRFTDSLLPAWVPQSPTVLNGITVPGLHNMIERMPPVTAKPAPYAAVYELNWLSASGTSCLLAGIAAALFLRVKPSQFVGIYKAVFKQLSLPMVTIASMLGLAYVMNYSGMTSTLGLALAASGFAFPFFSAVSSIATRGLSIAMRSSPNTAAMRPALRPKLTSRPNRLTLITPPSASTSWQPR